MSTIEKFIQPLPARQLVDRSANRRNYTHRIVIPGVRDIQDYVLNVYNRAKRSDGDLKDAPIMMLPSIEGMFVFQPDKDDYYYPGVQKKLENGNLRERGLWTNATLIKWDDENGVVLTGMFDQITNSIEEVINYMRQHPDYEICRNFRRADMKGVGRSLNFIIALGIAAQLYVPPFVYQYGFVEASPCANLFTVYHYSTKDELPGHNLRYKSGIDNIAEFQTFTLKTKPIYEVMCVGRICRISGTSYSRLTDSGAILVSMKLRDGNKTQNACNIVYEHIVPTHKDMITLSNGMNERNTLSDKRVSRGVDQKVKILPVASTNFKLNNKQQRDKHEIASPNNDSSFIKSEDDSDSTSDGEESSNVQLRNNYNEKQVMKTTDHDRFSDISARSEISKNSQSRGTTKSKDIDAATRLLTPTQDESLMTNLPVRSAKTRKSAKASRFNSSFANGPDDGSA